MAHDIKYIDKLARVNLEDFGQIPETNWSKFQSDFSGKLSPAFVSNSTAYSLTKNIVLSVVSMSILATGVFMYSEQGEDISQLPICKEAITKNIQSSEEVVYSIKQNLDIKKEDSVQINNNVISNKQENVVIRVEVPVYKKIEVRKEIIINDSVQN